MLSALVKIDKELRMKESYNENLANYIGRESCIVYCKVCFEALTVVHAGWVLSLVNPVVQGADAVKLSGRQQAECRYGKTQSHPAWSETPCTYGNSLYGNQEILSAVLTSFAVRPSQGNNQKCSL